MCKVIKVGEGIEASRLCRSFARTLRAFCSYVLSSAPNKTAMLCRLEHSLGTHRKMWSDHLPYLVALFHNLILALYGRSSRSRKQKARHAAEEHRRQLQALLQNKNPGRRDHGMNFDDLHDDGTELLGMDEKYTFF